MIGNTIKNIIIALMKTKYISPLINSKGYDDMMNFVNKISFKNRNIKILLTRHRTKINIVAIR